MNSATHHLTGAEKIMAANLEKDLVTLTNRMNETGRGWDRVNAVRGELARVRQGQR